ncbi:EscV/YscV/HrcV family type III secretion system export apparatus protein [Pseudomonas rubra]|uniref:EscV/YscV/HrcV family type III secretion system export apparatus protein n=1 Tax=Pseudomonas rubra TaxID=2942627 RepID=A0ABT5PCR9_9PSED|nr:EscV/YscV/HrcV family type III secretion system export apparatus protein [Pseudomonas rubra]MDD1039214.1 EscV/YscV/HrcV family type III secretion system export apparatus protein [Pseudomonas rubra]MDD1155184.1 EscV/YscV/HrcV family type III secretion system export apparatus protein [Pseudomonas rubra]
MTLVNLWLARLAARPELLILALMVMIIAMLIIPLPTLLVDFLIGVNIVLSLLIFMGSFYIERILSYSTFPALLLLTTLFRLALSISTSRLILTQADAGEIIASFGEFVIGENLVVGFVIFSIVTIVQFIVITKGSERVAEVAARFSLDGMPGKQMSIDGDLKAGAIDAAQARAKRSELERESQLYGSFDGAMKFIKGDAIAGIVIIFVNFIGGMAIGVGQLGMDLSTALTTYTLLTIGDGLVAQIPALLIAIGAGFIVTRVNGDDQNLGRNMLSQVSGNPFVLGVSAVLALGVGLLPGFPLAVFVFIAFTLVALLWRRHRRAQAGQSTAAGEGGGLAPGTGHAGAQAPLDIDRLNTETLALLLLVPPPRLDELQQARFAEHLRSQFFLDYGLRIAQPHLRAAPTLPEHQVTILINEVRADQFDLFFDHHRLLDFGEQLQDSGFEIKHGQDSNKAQSLWVAHSHSQAVAALGYPLRDAHQELYHSLAVVLARNIQEFFGVQETKSLLDELERQYPDLLKEVYRYVTVQKISEVLQRLISERISVRNMKLVMETLAHWASREKDTLALVEHVRAALARYISNKFARQDVLNVLLLGAEFEEVVRSAVRQTSAGNFVNLEPAQVEDLLDRVGAGLVDLYIPHKDLVVLCSVDVRRYIKKLIDNRFRELDVMSFAEVAENISVNVIKTL